MEWFLLQFLVITFFGVVHFWFTHKKAKQGNQQTLNFKLSKDTNLRRSLKSFLQLMEGVTNLVWYKTRKAWDPWLVWTLI